MVHFDNLLFFNRPDGNEVTRAQFLLALADVKTILVKATYSPGPQLASPVSASIEIAEADAYGPVASQVEQCKCPSGYMGTSCEDCMPGYTRLALHNYKFLLNHKFKKISYMSLHIFKILCAKKH